MEVGALPFGSPHAAEVANVRQEVEKLLQALAEASVAGLVRTLRCGGISVRTCRFAIRCSLSLASGQRKMRKYREALVAPLERGTMARAEVLGHARRFGDTANELYDLVDNKRRLIDLMADLDSAAIWPALLLYRLMAAHHERAAVWAEDFAETLALSASEEFTAAVVQAVHARP